MASTLDVRPAAVGDALAIAVLHRRSMPSAFMPRLGDGFLTRFYRALISDPGGVVEVATSGEEVLGFAAAAASMQAFSSRFRRRYAPGALLRALPVVVRPSIIRGLRETRSYLGDAEDLPDAEWISVAVEEEQRARGVGKQLMARLLADLDVRQVPALKIMIASDNRACQELVAGGGFHLARSVSIHDGVESGIWVRQ